MVALRFFIVIDHVTFIDSEAFVSLGNVRLLRGLERLGVAEGASTTCLLREMVGVA